MSPLHGSEEADKTKEISYWTLNKIFPAGLLKIFFWAQKSLKEFLELRYAKLRIDHFYSYHDRLDWYY